MLTQIQDDIMYSFRKTSNSMSSTVYITWRLLSGFNCGKRKKSNWCLKQSDFCGCCDSPCCHLDVFMENLEHTSLLLRIPKFCCKAELGAFFFNQSFSQKYVFIQHVGKKSLGAIKRSVFAGQQRQHAAMIALINIFIVSFFHCTL